MTNTPDHSDSNDLVVRGADGDPLPDPRGTRMIERESYERVVEGLKMASDACAHLARLEPQNGATWKEIGQVLDRMRLEAVKHAGLDLAMKQQETPDLRGAPMGWRAVRDRFLDGIRQATGGMRQLATCFRGDFTWSMMARGLEDRELHFRALLTGRRGPVQRPRSGLILPEGFASGVRH